MVGKTCAYASRVIATVEWPSISGMGLGNRIGSCSPVPRYSLAIPGNLGAGEVGFEDPP